MTEPLEPSTRVHAVWAALLKARPQHLAFLRRRLASPADAEDVLQVACLRATSHVDELRADDRLEPWFWRILRNTLADEHRRRGRERKIVAALPVEEAAPTPTETCACSLQALEKMRPSYREMLRRADVEDEPIESVAQTLGITPNNASVRLHRARSAMRSALQERCGTASVRGCQDCDCDGDAC